MNLKLYLSFIMMFATLFYFIAYLIENNSMYFAPTSFYGLVFTIWFIVFCYEYEKYIEKRGNK